MVERFDHKAIFLIAIRNPLHDLVSVGSVFGSGTERGGFDQPRVAKLLKNLCLRLKSLEAKDFDRLVDVLFLHGFLPSRDAF